MSKQSKDKKVASVRDTFEPLYERRLSDEEASEIDSNLTRFGRAILEIAGKVKIEPAK